jgi:hypothetical protein
MEENEEGRSMSAKQLNGDELLEAQTIKLDHPQRLDPFVLLFFFFSSFIGVFSCLSFLPSNRPPFPFVFVLCAADGDQNESKSERQKNTDKTPLPFCVNKTTAFFFLSRKSRWTKRISLRPLLDRVGEGVAKEPTYFKRAPVITQKTFRPGLAVFLAHLRLLSLCSKPSSPNLFLEEETRGERIKHEKETRDEG